MADHPAVQGIAERGQGRAPGSGPEPHQQEHPDRRQRVMQDDREVQGHPGLQEGIEQQVGRIGRAGLAFGKEREPSEDLRAPQGPAAELPLFRKEMADGIVLEREIEMEERAPEKSRFPEERRDEEEDEREGRKT